MDEAQSQFVADAQEIVERLHSDLQQLRVARLHGRRRRELAARIFRRVHTLKGSAGTLGLKSASQIAHEFEGVLDGVRLGRVEITDAVLDAFDDATDALTRALETTSPDEIPPGLARVTTSLNALAVNSRQEGAIASSLRAVLPPEIARSLSEYDLQHAREAIREGARLFVVSAGFVIETFDERFRELSRLLGETGEIVATVPGDAAAPDEINFRLLYAAELVASEVLRQASALGRIEVKELQVESGTVAAKSALDPSTSFPASTGAAPSTSVRVDLGQLEDLISDASELFREANRALASPRGPGANQTEHANLNRRFVALEERLIKLRLVPCAELLERAAARAGRIAARQLGKQVEFEIAGSDVGIDKALADTIAEPLLHLVRNAVGHGIESPEERKACGKSPTGKVTLAAFSEGSRIHITVTDDGRGIELNRIVAAANQQGIAGDRAALTLDQCLRLIFRPGFSTAAEVSELAGRGIGLDVVDRALAHAGGEVRVATEPGVGTTFVLILPAGLALVQCLTVRSGEWFYGIGSGRVAGHRLLNPEESEQITLTKTIEWDKEQLPVYSLSNLLNDASESLMPRSGSLVVWHSDPNRPPRAGVPDRLALLVDSIEGEHETLVRSLGRHAASWSGISGAAELPDGKVALVLDVEELIKARTQE